MACEPGAGPGAPGGFPALEGCAGGRGTVRLAQAADLDALVALREARAWRDTAADAAGGFLLGSDREQYRVHVEHGRVMVSFERGGGVAAFSVVLDDDAFRASSLWELRHHADVPIELLARFDGARLAYVDQLVARPGRGWASVRVAFRHAVAAMQQHDALLATTVVEPVVNGAALPLLRELGFEVVGHVTETYPRIGHLRSAVHLLTREAFDRRLAQPDARRFAAWVTGRAATADSMSA